MKTHEAHVYDTMSAFADTRHDLIAISHGNSRNQRGKRKNKAGNGGIDNNIEPAQCDRDAASAFTGGHLDSYNIYTDANVAEVARMTPVLEGLRSVR